MTSVNDIKDRVRTIISALLKGPVHIESPKERAFLQYIGRMSSRQKNWIIQDRRDDSQMKIIPDGPDGTYLTLDDFMNALDRFLCETTSHSHATRHTNNKHISIFLGGRKSLYNGDTINVYLPLLYNCICAYFGGRIIHDFNENEIILCVGISERCISVLFPLVKLPVL